MLFKKNEQSFASSDVLTALLLRMSFFWDETLLDPIIQWHSITPKKKGISTKSSYCQWNISYYVMNKMPALLRELS